MRFSFIFRPNFFQALVRGFLCRQCIRRKFFNEFHNKIIDWKEENEEGAKPERPLIDPIDAFQTFQRFLFVFNRLQDGQAFEKMCKYIISSMFDESNPDAIDNGRPPQPRRDYVTIAFDKRRTTSWIYQVTQLLHECCLRLNESRPEVIQFQSSIMLYLNMLISFSSCSTWKVFTDDPKTANQVLQTVMQRICANTLKYLVGKQFYQCLQELLMKSFCHSHNVLIKKSPLVATLSLTLRPLVYNEFNQDTMHLFFKHVLSVPALILHTNETCKEALAMFHKHKLFDHVINYLNDEKCLSSLFDQLEANYMICLLGNLIHLGHLNMDRLKSDHQTYMQLNSIVKLSLQRCEKFVHNRHTSLTHWHPLLGWFTQNVDERLHASLNLVKSQFQLFWNPQMVQLIHSHFVAAGNKPLLKEIPASCINLYANPRASAYPTFLKRAMDLVRSNSANLQTVATTALNEDLKAESLRKYFNENFVEISEICLTYTTAVSTLTQLKLDILTGLCYQDLLLPQLWKLIQSLNLKKGLEWLFFFQCLNANPLADTAEFQILILFCDYATHLIT